MNTFITSDLHFDHANILKYSAATRGHFANVEEMNEGIIAGYNAIVGPDDLTYLLGDISFSKPAKTVPHLQRLNGRKILVIGNHDEHLLKDSAFKNCFESIHQYLEIKHNGHKIVMFHYPIAEYNQCHRGAIHFHGHLHGNPSGLEQWRIIDVGYDATGNVVSTLDSMIEQAMLKPARGHGFNQGGHI
jgi:calcineurin-like phosphoesterase family protein